MGVKFSVSYLTKCSEEKNLIVLFNRREQLFLYCSFHSESLLYYLLRLFDLNIEVCWWDEYLLKAEFVV